MRKGLNPLITSVLYIGIVMAGIIIVTTVGIPALEKMKDVSAIDQVRGSFSNLDRIVREVAGEAEGSTRTVPLDIRRGELHIKDGQIYWTLETGASPVDPRSRFVTGNLVVGSDLEVKVGTEEVNGGYFYTLENDILKFYIKKIGTPSDHQSINASQLIYRIDNKAEGFNLTDYPVEIYLDNNSTKNVGTGFTNATTGTNLEKGVVDAYFYDVNGLNFKIEFILWSGSDFLVVNSERL